ncbi:MAG: hypothetical protein R6U61_04420 [Thermoplasmata archaeon]
MIGILLLLLTCWAIGNLLNAYPYVFTGGEKSPDLIAPASESEGSDVVKFPFKMAYYLFISSLIVASVAAVYEFTRGEEGSTEMGVKLLGLVIGGVVFYITLRIILMVNAPNSVFREYNVYDLPDLSVPAILIPIVIFVLIIYIFIFKKADTYVIDKWVTVRDEQGDDLKEKITSNVDETI